MTSSPISDKLAKLRRLTPSRVRFDGSRRAPALDAVLDFHASHAKARDAIHKGADWAHLETQLAPLSVTRLASLAPDRKTYLARPDLGRRLSEASAGSLAGHTAEGLVIVLGDGLSSFAVERNGAAMVHALTQALGDAVAPNVFFVEQARVAVADEIGEAVAATATVMLIGERPGLSVWDSLGAYFTWAPASGLPDSRRNCVSNIHANGGLSVTDAAARIAWLWQEARKMGASGVTLKDMSGTRPALTTDPERTDE